MPKLKPQTPSLTTLLLERDLLMSLLITALDEGDAEQMALTQETLDKIILPALATKTDALAHVLKYTLPNKVSELKDFEDAIHIKRKAIEGAIDGIKYRLKELNRTGQIGEVLLGDISQISITDGCLSVDDSECQPAEWSSEWDEYRTITVSYRVDKTRILADFKAGKELPPGITIKNGQRLSIKVRD